ncbi:hypothetical protein [Chryseobacterium cucumeris]|uniref:hypothetical protein n=1 Tax=Chryseobacterium cucumeris TaxID=1813611 RepID=UPI00192D6F18|nr:hypothetical protein [Chryseobacterium cucumeris]QRA41794.1 hypothetical protein JNG87_14320 [Chryseobacterium cucumeris]
MLTSGLHMKTYKGVITMLILVFSLSPCSVKRNVLDIFDIQYISGLNKVKTTSSLSFSCDTAFASSETAVSKTKIQNQYHKFLSGFNSAAANLFEEKAFLNNYSGHSTGNSPPKYILFKRLRLHLV